MNNNYKDLTDHSFGRLTAKRPIPKHKKITIWECVCKCGNIVLVRMDSLVDGSTKSCGCLRSESAKKTVKTMLNRKHSWDNVEGTALTSMNMKLRKDNTSGVKGVSQKKNKDWVSYIYFKGRRIHLGTFRDKQDAKKELEELKKTISKLDEILSK